MKHRLVKQLRSEIKQLKSRISELERIQPKSYKILGRKIDYIFLDEWSMISKSEYHNKED